MNTLVNVINNARIPTASLKPIKDAVKTTLQIINPDLSCTVNLKISFAKEITEYNRQYFNKDSVTDVISFTLNDKDLETGEWILGDIIICSDVAQQEAAERNKTADEELALYAAHGTLHLLGYTDDTEINRKKMVDLQNQVIERIYG